MVTTTKKVWGLQPNRDPNPTDVVRQKFDSVPAWPWEFIEKELSAREGKPFCLEYKQLNAPNFQDKIVSRYVLGIVDPLAWGESTSPKCLDYGDDRPISAIGNLSLYFRKPSWAWEQKKIVGMSVDETEFAGHFYKVLRQLIRIADQREETLRAEKRAQVEEWLTSSEDQYLHLILHQLFKQVKGEKFMEAMEKYLDILRRIQEHWINHEQYYKLQMVNSQKAHKHYQGLERILSS